MRSPGRGDNPGPFGCRVGWGPYDEYAELALSAPSGSDGIVLVPFLAGERTPNLPDATASVFGLSSMNLSRANLARAGVEAMICLLGCCVERLVQAGTPIDRVLLVGGGAKSEATRRVASSVLGRVVDVPSDAEYVALGAARQAAWVLGETLPLWSGAGSATYSEQADPKVLDRYQQVVAENY